MTTQRPLLTAEEIWRAYDDVERRLTAPVSERMLDLAELRPGMRVLDLATGRGEPAVRAAHRVGPTGAVLGVDLSEGLLQMARERAAREGLSNLDLRAMSAESLEGVPAAHFHATLARWGLMYMDSPLAALSAARRAMVPRGVLVAAVWAEPERVSYFTLPRRVLTGAVVGGGAGTTERHWLSRAILDYGPQRSVGGTVPPCGSVSIVR